MVTWVRATVAAASAAVPPCLSASSPAWIAIGERVAAISADCPSMTLACEGNGLFSSYGHRNLPWKDNCKSQARPCFATANRISRLRFTSTASLRKTSRRKRSTWRLWPCRCPLQTRCSKSNRAGLRTGSDMEGGRNVCKSKKRNGRHEETRTPDLYRVNSLPDVKPDGTK